jgi:hypothetical protein
MRITLSLDDDVFQLVKQYAQTRSLAMGKALSELVRRGVGAPPKTRRVSGLVVVELPEDSSPVTSEHVKELESEGR